MTLKKLFDEAFLNYYISDNITIVFRFEDFTRLVCWYCFY